MNSAQSSKNSESKGEVSSEPLDSLKGIPSTARPYQYQPLSTTSSIRLLKATKTSELSKEHYSLHSFPLEDAPNYIALSYTWGNATAPLKSTAVNFEETLSAPRSGQLDLDGYSLPIKDNLFDFLHAWRPETHTEFIWIDAICINQEDLIEKKNQVPLMGDIYSSAKHVIIWLGSSKNHIESLQWVCGDFYNAVSSYVKRHGENSLKQWALISPELNEQLGIDLPMKQCFKYWTEFVYFTHNRRWFSRMWVVQEVVLAKEIIVMCGDGVRLPWEAFLRLPKLVSRKGVAEKELDEAASRLETYNDVKKILDYMMGNKNQDIITDLRLDMIAGGRDDPKRRWYAIVFLLLLKTRYLDTSDSRDGIYAILGVANKGLPSGMDPPFIPDYERSEKEVFINVSAQLIQNLPGLVFLAQTMSSPRHKANELPSWVADLHFFDSSKDSMRSLCMDVYFGIPSFAAWPMQNLNTQPVSFCNDTMITRGGEFDLVIAKVTLPISSGVPGLASFLQFCLQLDPVYAPTGQTRAEAIWRTMIADTAGGSFPAPGGEKEGVRRIFRDGTCDLVFQDSKAPWINDLPLDAFTEAGDHDVFPTRLEITRDAEELGSKLDKARYDGNAWLTTLTSIYNELGSLRSDWIAMYDTIAGGRSIFRTEKGYIGLGSDWMEFGDSVCFLEHGKVPFILKREQNADRYRFVGEAYLHGFMHGQAITSDFMERFKQINII